jgi:hypothetical protein
MEIYTTSEKIIVWLHRNNKTQVWLAEQMGTKKQNVTNKIKSNTFSIGDILTFKRLKILE